MSCCATCWIASVQKRSRYGALSKSDFVVWAATLAVHGKSGLKVVHA